MVSGLTAGVAAAILSQVCFPLLLPISFQDFQCEPEFLVIQPADTLLSEINKGHSPQLEHHFRQGPSAVPCHGCLIGCQPTGGPE